MRKIYKFLATALVTLLLTGTFSLNAQDSFKPITIWIDSTLIFEDFEDASDWSFTGEFETGTPSYEFGSYDGSAAGTDLDSYVGTTYHYIYSPYFDIPADARNVELSFYQAWDYYYGSRRLYIQSPEFGSNQIYNSGYSYNAYSDWSFYNYSLQNHIGQNVRFYSYLYNPNDYANYDGWYFDNFTVECEVPFSKPGTHAVILDEEMDTVSSGEIVEDYFSTIEPTIYKAFIGNYGLDTLKIDSVISINGLISVEYNMDYVPYNMAQPLRVIYSATEQGTVTDTLKVYTNSPNSPWIMTIEGEANPGPLEPTPVFSYLDEEINPGNFLDPILLADTIQDDLWDGTQIDFDFVLTNTGATPLDINQIGWKYSNDYAYDIESFPSYYLEFEDSITVTLSWYADAARKQVAAFYFDYYLRDETFIREDFWLSARNSYAGTAMEIDGPWFTAATDSLVYDFGDIEVGGSYFRNDFGVRNWGSVPLNISIEVIGNGFEFVGETEYTLKPGQMNWDWSDEGIRFTPSDSVGIKEGLLIITHNDTTEGAIDTVYLFGKGFIEEEPVMPNPAELTFYFEDNPIETGSNLDIDLGTVIEYNDYKTQWFEIVNTGDKSGYIDLNYLGSNWDWAEKDGNYYSSYYDMEVEPGDTLTIGIRFDPTYGDKFQNSTSIELKGESTDWIYFNLSGIGLERHKFLVEVYGYDNIYEYENVNLYTHDGYRDTVDFSYTNLHESTIKIESILFENENGMSYMTASGLPVTLNPGENYDFYTHFDPDYAGDNDRGTVKIYTDNTKEPIYIYYLDFYANGYSQFEFELINDTILYYSGSLNFRDVSTVDGIRTANMRIVPTNGYGVIIDTTQIFASEEYFSGSNLPDNTSIRANRTYNFDLIFSPIGHEMHDDYLNANAFFYYKEHNQPYGAYTQSRNFNMYGYTVTDKSDQGELTVQFGNTTIANGGTLDMGSVPMNNGIEDIMVFVKNSGVEPIVVDTVTFSNPAFSIHQYEGMFEENWLVDSYGEQTVLYFNPDVADVVEGTATLHVIYPTKYDYVLNLRGTGTSGVNEITLEDASVFPNPASGIVYLNTGVETETQTIIYNTSGKMVYSGLVANGQSIDISDFEGGVYIIKLQSEEGQSTLKLIKE